MLRHEEIIQHEYLFHKQLFLSQMNSDVLDPHKEYHVVHKGRAISKERTKVHYIKYFAFPGIDVLIQYMFTRPFL